MRVYGALMWSLGKVLNTPEVSRVYIGSFNDKPVNESPVGPIGKELFEREQDDLLSDLKDMPKKACDRRINEFVKRARAAKIHAYIIGHLKKEMPTISGFHFGAPSHAAATSTPPTKSDGCSRRNFGARLLLRARLLQRPPDQRPLRSNQR